MIRALVRFGRWLESRFPEKMVVTAADYGYLNKNIESAHTELALLRDEVRTLVANHAATIDRVARVEAAAVHKGAVQDLVTVVKAVQTDMVALKANLGWSKPILEAADSVASLNGELI